MSEQRDTEWAPHPDKAEQIFLNVVVGRLIDRGLVDRCYAEPDGDAPMPDAEPTLLRMLIDASKAWQSYASTSRRGRLSSIRSVMEFADSEEALRRSADELAKIPQTSVERESSLEIFRRSLNALRAAKGPPQQ
jgi:hypothetical protein